MKICEYGCGREAKYPPRRGMKKWCCEDRWERCPAKRQNMREKTSGKNLSAEHKEKIRSSLKGKPKPTGFSEKVSSLKKGNVYRLGQKQSEITKQKISEKNKGKKRTTEFKSLMSKMKKGTSGYWKNKKRSNNTKEKISKTLRLDLKEYKKRYPFFCRIEDLRERPKNKKIQARCKNHNCPNSKEKGGWFTPTSTQLYERIRNLEKDYGNGGGYLYCCDKCKQDCPLYNLSSDPNKTVEKLYTSEEYNTWRQEVLKRADYECEYCGESANHCHHSRPQKLDPFFSLDPDYGIACCEKCHYKYGHKTGTECSTGNLASNLCIGGR